MNEIFNIDFSEISLEKSPFPHFYTDEIFRSGTDIEIYNWLKETTSWHLTETDFYEQHEFEIDQNSLPEKLNGIISRDSIAYIINQFKEAFEITDLQLVNIVAHKLIDGQKIAIHNDFINGEETHRLVIHFNPAWEEDHGGFLMLFNSSDAQEVSKVIAPLNNSAFGFEISTKSYHAVSKIYNSCRYSIVYTFTQSIGRNDVNS